MYKDLNIQDTLECIHLTKSFINDIQNTDSEKISSFMFSNTYIHKEINNDDKYTYTDDNGDSMFIPYVARDIIRLCGCPQCSKQTRLRLYYNKELEIFTLSSKTFTFNNKEILKEFSMFYSSSNVFTNVLSKKKFVDYNPIKTAHNCEIKSVAHSHMYFTKYNQYKTY